MLLNLSNHPSITWPPNQKQAAQEVFGELADLPFPQIDPLINSADLDLLVDEFVNKVRMADPIAVHLMGELTFTFRLATRLKAAGIRVVASTTERIVTLDGSGHKTSAFRFVQFRDY